MHNNNAANKCKSVTHACSVLSYLFSHQVYKYIINIMIIHIYMNKKWPNFLKWAKFDIRSDLICLITILYYQSVI